MLSEYLKAAMAKAHYKLLDDGEGFYGEIPGFQGVLAQADTLEACREELASTLEDWLLFRISRGLPTPVLDGLDLSVKGIADFRLMPRFGPIKRRELVACLRRLGYSGPYAGGRHEFMLRGALSVTIPNPHGRDIGPNRAMNSINVPPYSGSATFSLVVLLILHTCVTVAAYRFCQTNYAAGAS